MPKPSRCGEHGSLEPGAWGLYLFGLYLFEWLDALECADVPSPSISVYLACPAALV
jgi:hypothetical protein